MNKVSFQPLHIFAGLSYRKGVEFSEDFRLAAFKLPSVELIQECTPRQVKDGYLHNIIVPRVHVIRIGKKL